MGDYAISRRPLHPRMQVLQAPPKARATIAVVASLLAIGFVTLMISSVSDHPDFVAAEVEVGQERDPTALVADPTALTGADRFAEPAKAVTAADIVNAQEEVEVEADPTRLPKLPAKKKNPSKGGQAVSTLNRMEKNLIDLRAFIEVDQDNIEELTLTGGEEADIIKPMYQILKKAKVSELLPAWEAFAQDMQKKHPLPASIAHYMTTKMTKELASHKGLLSVHGKGRHAHVAIGGNKVGLESTPHTWKKYMKAPLNKVLKRAKAISDSMKKKIKKKKLWLSVGEQKELWGSSCAEDEAFGESYSMGCKRYKKKEECHQHGGCVWQTGWEGK